MFRQPAFRLTALPVLAAPMLVLLGGCATQAPPEQNLESPYPAAVQQQAQQAVVTAAPGQPRLKRRIALGRVTNETTYGRSLLREENGEAVGKQVADMLAKALTESGAFVVFERTDIDKLEAERARAGMAGRLAGVDALVMGSLTGFGRKTEGKTGFVSASKKQVAFANVDLRVVDVGTGQSFLAVSGAGEATNETAVTFGFGSEAAYDATLNDNAIRAAVADTVNRLTTALAAQPWQTGILAAKDGGYYLAGGKAQGIRPGMRFSVQTIGQKVRSPQTGVDITLPGKEVAQLRVDSLFGDDELHEGALASLVGGSLAGARFDQLVVRLAEAQ